MPTEVLGVIPARYASTRFPGKSLAVIAGKPMVQHVYERASQCARFTRLVIATDDGRIAEAARSFGAECQMTRPDHQSGTDRVAEVAAGFAGELVVNIQGDEPLIDFNAIEAVIVALETTPGAKMATLGKRITSPGEVENPNVVKVVKDLGGNAIYFSRYPIPYQRGGPAALYKHIGLYAYRRDFLLQYSSMPVGPLEKAECLEQLRALENGHRIAVAETAYDSLGVDTPEDLMEIRQWLEARMGTAAPLAGEGS
ncbi:MAG: 3-deoxy-manno-octulosonate cytidylyltransferase [Bryobacterales bacterium]|nr:3-deoxy-manno-octulosonate cytidylyltransferase [Bryobacterales bacterium]